MLSSARPGVFAALLSVVALDYYFIPPLHALGISLEEAPDMIVFVATALFIGWLSGEQNLGGTLSPTNLVMWRTNAALSCEHGVYESNAT
jgi:hypothetical protein